MTHDLLAKLDSLGKDLDQFSLETVQMFHRDAVAAGLHALADAARLHHRRRRVHRQHARRPPERATASRSSIVDDFRTGRREFVAELLERPARRLVEGDVLDEALLEDAFAGCDWVFHLQANADVRHGLEHPRADLEQNTIATVDRARGDARARA